MGCWESRAARKHDSDGGGGGSGWVKRALPDPSLALCLLDPISQHLLEKRQTHKAPARPALMTSPLTCPTRTPALVLPTIQARAKALRGHAALPPPPVPRCLRRPETSGNTRFRVLSRSLSPSKGRCSVGRRDDDSPRALVEPGHGVRGGHHRQPGSLARCAGDLPRKVSVMNGSPLSRHTGEASACAREHR